MIPIIVPMRVTASEQTVPMRMPTNSEDISLRIGAEVGYTGPKGDTGVGIESAVLNPDYTLTLNYTDGTSFTSTSIRGAQGVQGEQGPSGEDGISPSVRIIEGEGKRTIAITDRQGTHTTTVLDGETGPRGPEGPEGPSGQPGRDGSDGKDGQDGFSPTATVSKSGDTTTISITDKNGTTTASVMDGTTPDMTAYRTASEQDDIDDTKLGKTETAHRSAAIYYGQVDSTSTSTKFTATIPGITEYYDGLTILLKNGIVTSASGFTININNLGGKQAYSNMAAATAETTLFNINYTMLFVYDSTRVEGGGWVMYRGYNANDNTIGYQLRTNSSSRPTADKFYRYRLLFTSADNTQWVPANTSTSTNATASRTPNSRPINPFGEIVYYGTTTAVDANATPAAASLWEQYVLTLGYSFNNTGAALVLPYPSPIYLKCAPQADGSAIIDANNPYVTSLPSAEDGKIYIYLGRIYSATNIELLPVHPVYYYKDGSIRLWTNAPSNGGGGGAVDSVNGKTGTVVLDAEDVGALPDDTAIPSKTSDLTNDSGYITGMTILSYGSSTWNDFKTAYDAKKVVYCRASSNSNPATGSQTRLAFMAYVNNADTPTEVEFQYYRSVSAHSDTQQGDQVYVYKLTSGGTWSVTTRECYTRVVAGTGLKATWSNGILTISLDS